MDHKKKVSVIGIGRLGLCWALTLERGGYSVLGFDINKDYIESIQNGTFTSYEPNVNKYLKKSKKLK